MTSTQKLLKLQQEGRLLLAANALQKNQNLGLRKTAGSYDVPKSTLYCRLNGATPQSASNLQKRKLQPSEEHALVQ